MSTAFDDHIGRTEALDEVIHPMRMRQAAAMLGLGAGAGDRLAAEGAPLPPLFHLFFTNSLADAGALNPDGHERLGGFMPDVLAAGPFKGRPTVRRMWAAGDMRFEGALPVGALAKRTSTIASIEEKSGSTGTLLFVEVERRIEAGGGRVVERRTVVYREPPSGAAMAPESQPVEGGEGLADIHGWRPDEVQLFRFSALTWNGHRIHYDAGHCRDSEGYPGLVVHGPFTAMMLALAATGAVGASGMSPDLAGERTLGRFRFRGTQPLFAGNEVRLHADGGFGRLEARNHLGQLAMKAEAGFA